MTAARTLFLTPLALFALATTAPAQNGADVKIGGDFEVEAIPDIAYYTGPDADPNKHKLDLYVPKGHKDYPVLVFIHGGAWSTGDRKLYGGVGRLFAKNGVGTAVISYRLSPQVHHPAHIEDVAHAFAWTHANIAKHGGRVDQIFVSGHSAGGHLAALLATDEQYLRKHQLSAQDIKGVLPLSGVYQIPPGPLDAIFGTDPVVAANAAPLKHVSGREPPFLIVYADGDFRGCDQMSEMLLRELRAKKVEAECISMYGRTHISIMLRLMLSEADPATQAMLGFIAKHSDLKLKSRQTGEPK